MALAIMPVVMVGASLKACSPYVTSSVSYSKYLLFPHIAGASRQLIFSSAMAGAGLAFLAGSATHPAQVFMPLTSSIGAWAPRSAPSR